LYTEHEHAEFIGIVQKMPKTACTVLTGGMETKLRETKLKLENSGEMRHTLVLWNQIISAIFRVQAWETKLK
jgi:hypothetical protein